jgi:glutamate-ammonia-ligase adenylyltransferase
MDAVRLLAGLWQGVVEKESGREILRRLGYTDPDKVLYLIATLREDRTLKSLSAVGRERLNRLLPLVLQAVSQAQDPELVLGRTFDLIKSIQRRTSYLALLLENPAALTHLVRLSEASPWIAAFLSRHPVLLDELLDPRTLYRPPLRKALIEELQQRLAGIDALDLEYQMEVLRVFKQVNVLRVAASDVTDVLPLMKVSDHLSDIAEILLEKVVAVCWQDMSRKYGTPLCRLDNQVCDHGFTVIAYGKLGGLELGYGSDLDLVFMHAAEPGNTTGGAKSLDNALFFSRLGQRVLHFLTTHTSAGILYEADMRLRPSGISGMLVSHVDGFRDYQLGDAWIWEHQALIRARAITGDPALKQRFEDIRKQVLTQVRDEKRLCAEVAEMRAKMRRTLQSEQADVFDIKQGLGGIVDIEFLVQYLVLRHAHRHPEILRWTDNVRLLQSLNETGILDDTTAFGLRRAYLVFRAMVHRLNLKQQPALIRDQRFDAARQFVVQAWNRYLAPPELSLKATGAAGPPELPA